jgi:MiaB/RimO family radical SAM methylthiotransferase
MFKKTIKSNRFSKFIHQLALKDKNLRPTLSEFINANRSKRNENDVTSISPKTTSQLKFHIETYGCQMNLSDSEIVRSILISAGHEYTDDLNHADVILTNTCAIRENAEMKVWNRLDNFQSMRKKNKLKNIKSYYPIIGVLGCMAERLKEKLLEKDSVDFVCGPDAYRDIPRLLENVVSVDQKEANTRLSLEETYADINPIRETNSNSAFVSIMRGCNNMCSFCIVPFTRGRERSRQMSTILNEIQTLCASNSIKEIVLLGQNVNGYHDSSDESALQYPTAMYKHTPGFNNLYNSRKRDLPGARFHDLLEQIADINPELRIRFTSPHPKDFPLEVLEVIKNKQNICKSIHMPLQSGSSAVLQRMRRGYTSEAFLSLIDRVKEIIPDVAISTDIITGCF